MTEIENLHPGSLSKPIQITEVDKGNRTVVMNLEKYDTKMLQLANDADTFEPV